MTKPKASKNVSILVVPKPDAEVRWLNVWRWLMTPSVPNGTGGGSMGSSSPLPEAALERLLEGAGQPNNRAGREA